MKIIHGFPPNFAVLNQHFKIRGKPVFISYGEILYVPMKTKVPPEILEHEKVHGLRQRMMGVQAWWKEYIDDSHFRYKEELMGHRAEAKWLHDHGVNAEIAIDEVARRLSGSLYGNMVTFDAAKRDILEGL